MDADAEMASADKGAFRCCTPWMESAGD